MKLRSVLDIVTLMETMFSPTLYALDFTHEHYIALLKELHIHEDAEEFEKKKGTLKQGIKDYFWKTIQVVELELSPVDFKLEKVFFLDDNKDESYDRILHSNAIKLLEIAANHEEYRLLPFLISIPSEIRDVLIENFTHMSVPINKIRRDIRVQMEKIFRLNEKDIILFLRGKISLRFYIPPQKYEDGKDRRFNGQDPELMAKLYHHYFPEGAWSYISDVLDEVLNEKLNFGMINNLYYRKNFIPVFRCMIEILLVDVISLDDRDYVEGLSGYVLRQHFDQILYHTAENLLMFVENRDKNAQTFIKDYTDDIIVDANGNRIQKYAIVDMKKQSWNYSSIVSLVMQYKQVKARVSSQEEAIIAALSRLEEVKEEMKAEKRNKDASLAKITEIEQTMAHDDIVYLKSKRNLDFVPDSALSLPEKRRKQQLADLKTEKSNLELINKRIANKSVEMSRRSKKVEHEEKMLENLKTQMVPIVETYNLMAHAVAVVLAKR